MVADPIESFGLISSATRENALAIKTCVTYFQISDTTTNEIELSYENSHVLTWMKAHERPNRFMNNLAGSAHITCKCFV